jgi:hypothetical protein
MENGTDVSHSVSLKSRLSMSDLRALMLQMRKQIEFRADGETRTEYVPFIISGDTRPY